MNSNSERWHFSKEYPFLENKIQRDLDYPGGQTEGWIYNFPKSEKFPISILEILKKIL